LRAFPVKDWERDKSVGVDLPISEIYRGVVFG
jgi:hypothetical protein